MGFLFSINLDRKFPNASATAIDHVTYSMHGRRGLSKLVLAPQKFFTHFAHIPFKPPFRNPGSTTDKHNDGLQSRGLAYSLSDKL